MVPITFTPADASKPSPADKAVKIITTSSGAGKGMHLKYLQEVDIHLSHGDCRCTAASAAAACAREPATPCQLLSVGNGGTADKSPAYEL